MTVFTKTAVDIFAAQDASGDARKVSNHDAQVWGTEVERAIKSFQAGGGVVFDSKTEADGSLDYNAYTMAWVFDVDPDKAGIYQKQGASGSGSWQRVGDLPYSFILATNSNSGNPNAIEATTAIPIPAADGGALIALPIVADNTASPVSVSFNGGPALTIKTIAGNDVPIAALAAGMIVWGFKQGDEFRLATDLSSAAIQAAAEAAAAEAEAARDVATGAMTTVIDPQFSTIATAEAYSPVVAPDYIRTAGYAAAGDGGGALYKKAASEPSHPGKFSITLDDGVTVVWYELAEAYPNQFMFGAVDDADVDSIAALKNLHAFCEATGARYRYAPGTHKISETLVILSSGDASAASIYADATTVDPAVRVGVTTPGGANLMRELKVSLPRVYNSAKIGTGWTGFENSIGIQLCSSYDCFYYVPNVEGFGIGLRISGFGTGFSYNYVTIGVLYNNKINLRLQPGDDNGWVNENIFYGGRYGCQSNEGTAVSGVRYIQLIEASENAVFSPPNGNVFLKPSIENNVPEYHMDIQGSNNTIEAARWEASLGPKVRIYSRTSGQSSRNLFLSGYAPDNIAFTYEGAGSRWNGMASAKHTVIQGGGSLPALALGMSGGDSSDQPHIIGLSATKNPLGHDFTLGDWNYRLYGNGLDGKRSTDTAPRVGLDFQNGRINFGTGTGSPSGYMSASSTDYLGVSSNGGFRPLSDNAMSLGTASLRWSQIFAGNATINTSDAREKEWRGELNDAEIRVAKRLSKLIGIYQWKSAIEAKGEDARLHCGVTAQDVKAAFDAEGLDGFRYGVLCFDEWDSEYEDVLDAEGVPTGEQTLTIKAGDRYGIRYDQLWAFVAAGFEARLSALEEHNDDS